MSLLLIIAGVIAVVVSNNITTGILSQYHPEPHMQRALFDAAAGTGLVPGWVSFIHLSGMLGIVVGVIALLAN